MGLLCAWQVTPWDYCPQLPEYASVVLRDVGDGAGSEQIGAVGLCLCPKSRLGLVFIACEVVRGSVIEGVTDSASQICIVIVTSIGRRAP